MNTNTTLLTSTIEWNSIPPSRNGHYLVATSAIVCGAYWVEDIWLIEADDENNGSPLQKLEGVQLWAEFPQSPLLRPVGENEYPY